MKVHRTKLVLGCVASAITIVGIVVALINPNSRSVVNPIDVAPEVKIEGATYGGALNPAHQAQYGRDVTRDAKKGAMVLRPVFKAEKAMKAALRSGDLTIVRQRFNEFLQVLDLPGVSRGPGGTLLAAGIYLNDPRAQERSISTSPSGRHLTGMYLYSKIWFEGATSEERSALVSDVRSGSLGLRCNLDSALTESEVKDLALMATLHHGGSYPKLVPLLHARISSARFDKAANLHLASAYQRSFEFEAAIEKASPYLADENKAISGLAKNIVFASRFEIWKRLHAVKVNVAQAGLDPDALQDDQSERKSR